MTGENPILACSWQRRGGSQIPFQVNLELTRACNLSCRHCYLGPAHRHEHELDTRQWRRVCDGVLDLGVHFLGFTGGEVFVRPDFIELARYARDRGLFFFLQTNGTRIDADMADIVHELNPTKVEISLYGATASVHDGITRSKGSFDRSVRAIGLLRDRGIRVVVKTTVMSLNCHQVGGIERLAAAAGAFFLPDPVVMPAADGNASPLAYAMDDNQFRSFMVDRGWDRGRPEDDCGRAVAAADPVADAADKERRLICSAARRTFAISAGGDMLPCVLWRQSAGSVLDADLPSLWGSELFHRIREIGIKDLKECNRCCKLATCIRCAAAAWIAGGDYTGAAPQSCHMSKLLREVKDSGKETLPGA